MWQKIVIGATATLALLGIGWMLWLLASRPTLEFPDGTARCFSVLTAPQAKSNLASTHNLDDELIDRNIGEGDLVTHVDRCARLRGRRLGLAMLLTMPTAVLATVAVVSLYQRRLIFRAWDEGIIDSKQRARLEGRRPS